MQGPYQAIDALKALLVATLLILLAGRGTQHDTLVGTLLPAFEQLCTNHFLPKINPRQVALQSTPQIDHPLVTITTSCIRDNAKIQIHTVLTAIQQIQKTHRIGWIKTGINVCQCMAVCLMGFFVDLIKANQPRLRPAQKTGGKGNTGNLQ